MNRFLVIFLFLASCTMPDATPIPLTPTQLSPAGWELIEPGLERRSFLPDANGLKEISVLRIDPNLFTFRVHYRPGEPLNIGEWSRELPEAEVIVNANLFDPQNQIVGLLISDGVVYGWSYTDRGGMFYIQDDVPRIRSNIAHPYIPGEPIQQAVQAYPMLVIDGQQAFTNTNNDRITRRTAIGIDYEGRVLIMVTPLAGLGLVELSAFLANTPELDLSMAFNLDGGGSTMRYIATIDDMLLSFDPVPAVLAVYRR